jgi:hypothetical protein
VAWATESPPDFVAVPLLAFAGGAIGNSRWLRVTRIHREPPCVFAYIVGRPSSGKSPVFRQLKAPFITAQKEYRKRHKTELEQWEKNASENKGPRPVFRRCLTDNATVESILQILSQNPRGVLLARGELSGLIGGFNQYKEGGRGNDRETFLQFWDCESIIVDRKSNPDGYPLVTERPFVGVVGTIQPKVVDKLRRQDGTALDDGFLERFLCSYPDPMPAAAYSRQEASAESIAAWDAAARWLLSLDMEGVGDDRRPRFLRLSATGMAAWIEFTRRHAEEVNDPAFPEHLEAAWGKIRGYCLRFALILHLLDSAVDGLDEEEIDGLAIERAARLADYFKAHVRRVGTVLDLDPRVAQAKKVLAWLKSWGKPTVSRRDLWRGLRRSFNRPEELYPPLQLLHHANYVRPVIGEAHQSGDSRRGQPTDVYEINPTITSLVTGDMGDMGDNTESRNAGARSDTEIRNAGTSPMSPMSPVTREVTGDIGDAWEGS